MSLEEAIATYAVDSQEAAKTLGATVRFRAALAEANRRHDLEVLRLARRVSYGGRKGRSARRRLAAMGYEVAWQLPDGRRVPVGAREMLADLPAALIGRPSP